MSIGRDVIRKFLNGDVDLIETNKLPEILSEIARTMITEGLSEDEYYVEINFSGSGGIYPFETGMYSESIVSHKSYYRNKL